MPIVNENPLPSLAEVGEAMDKAKDLGIPHKELIIARGVEMVRLCLAPEYRWIGDDELRLRIQSTNKGKHGKSRIPKPVDFCWRKLIKKIENEFPRLESHSEEYYDLHFSHEFRDFVSSLKEKLMYRCQACSRFPAIEKLQAHIVDYTKWREPGMVLIVCDVPCHGLLDGLRRWGRNTGDAELEEFKLA